MTKLDLVFAGALLATLIPTPALAGPIFGNDAPRDSGMERAARSEVWRPGFGARVGGYGFQSHGG